MFARLNRFIHWLNDSEPDNMSSSSDTRCVPEGFVMPDTRANIEHDEIIKDKLRVLKRSGLALPFEVWPEFVVDTVVNYAQWCQALPASESYHHTGKRGLLLHSLDVAIYAMRLRRNFILPPNTPPEEVIHREIVWVYGVFLCALLHDSGKINDFEIELYQENGNPLAWSPVSGPITTPYRFRYHKARQYATHQYTGHTLLPQLLCHDAMLAISHDKALYHAMVEYLSGNASPDNVMAQIITQADAASVAQDLGADKAGINLAAEKARGAQTSLAGQLRLTLTHLLTSDTIPLNKKGAEGFVDGESLYLMCKPIADRLRSTLLERGITAVPSDNSRLFNELQQHHIIRPNADDMAVWKCDVWLSEFDWRQTFTFVCVHWPSLVPEAKFDSIQGSITPVDGEASPDDVAAEPVTDVASVARDDSTFSLPSSSLEASTQEATLPVNDAVSDDLMAFMTQISAPEEASQEPVLEPMVEAEDEPEVRLPTLSDPSMDVEDEANASSSDSDIDDALARTIDDAHPLLRQIDLRDTHGQALGQAFYDWMDAVLKGGVHPVNGKGALFHRVEQGLFVVSPGAFRTFIDERCQYAKTNSYSEVQQGLQPLGLHLVSSNGRNVHKALIKDSTSTLNGFLFPLSTEWEMRYAVNPYVVVEGV
ncbi:TPA: MobH family relaxase [Vibrio parahaemolyticus]